MRKIFCFPSDKSDRPIISYKIEEGSVRHVFRTSIQFIIGFNAIIGQVDKTKNIDFLDLSTARALENFQDIAAKKDYAFTIKTSVEQTNELKIDRTTRLYRSEAAWVEAEFYFYGKVTNAGGKDKANIHILTDDHGTLRITTPITFLEQYEENLLYKTFGVRATGKQQSETGEIDSNSLKFVELIDYHPKYDEAYLRALGRKQNHGLQQ
jgi:hypothetical protein